MEIGFIGLGKMGFPMARRLIEAGNQLSVFDTSTQALDRLTEAQRGTQREVARLGERMAGAIIRGAAAPAEMEE